MLQEKMMIMIELLTRIKFLNRGLTGLVLCSLLLFRIPGPTIEETPATRSCLHTSGNKILDDSNKVVRFSGLNWFGFETSNKAPDGLWARSWKGILDQIKRQGYNVIRLPFSSAMLKQGAKPSGINYRINPDLEGLTSLQVMDKIISGAGARGLKIILDNHRSTSGGGPESGGLWYTAEYPESRWITDWKMLASRYKYSKALIGVDLRNEPHGGCWGCGSPVRDWRLAAEKAGNAILSVNPDLLIIVEGVFEYDRQYTWWGGNLIGAKDYPVRLDVPNRLVYSAHEYPESIYPQPWFRAPNYPENLPAIWEKYWGYLVSENIAPVLIGEFGTRYETEKDRQWLVAFQSYIQKNKLSWTFWSLNPNSGDTGGLLLDNWISVNQSKQNILKQIQYPLIESSCSRER
jgi:aryl-phospho-beta-D-glucosidase BglC (GH1 family)